MLRRAEDYISLLNSDDVDEPSHYDEADDDEATYDEATNEIWLDMIERLPEARREVARNKTVSEPVIRARHAVGG